MLIDVPQFQFAALNGQIAPGIQVDQDQGFNQAVEALYEISYGLKFTSKHLENEPIDYVVLPLEGLWWTDTSHHGFDFNRDETWYCQLQIRQPDHIDESVFSQALEKLKDKKGEGNPRIADLALIKFDEGISIQTMHLGPYSNEPATLLKLDAFAKSHGLRMRGRHHEIYIGDPRRAKPENLKTVLRHPVEQDN